MFIDIFSGLEYQIFKEVVITTNYNKAKTVICLETTNPKHHSDMQIVSISGLQVPARRQRPDRQRTVGNLNHRTGLYQTDAG